MSLRTLWIIKPLSCIWFLKSITFFCIFIWKILKVTFPGKGSVGLVVRFMCHRNFVFNHECTWTGNWDILVRQGGWDCQLSLMHFLNSPFLRFLSAVAQCLVILGLAYTPAREPRQSGKWNCSDTFKTHWLKEEQILGEKLMTDWY